MADAPAPFTPTPPPDQFAGAEQDVEAQRLAALKAVAAFGREGVNRILAAKQASQAATAAEPAQLAATTTLYGGSPEAAAQVAALGTSQAIGGYDNLLQNTSKFVASENKASDAVQNNYFKQLSEAIPLYRQHAADITEQYRVAYEKRQAEIAHEAEMEKERQAQVQAQIDAINQQAAAQAQAAAEQLAQIQALAAASGGGGGGGGGYYPEPPPGPGPAPQETLQSLQQKYPWAFDTNPLAIAATIGARKALALQYPWAFPDLAPQPVPAAATVRRAA